MSKETITKYSRTIRLSPALGDWTRLTKSSIHSNPSLKITSVQSARFDGLKKDTFQIAHRIHYRLGELICDKLSKDMDIKVELHSVTAAQMMYSELVQSLDSQIIQSDLVSLVGDRINILVDWALAEQIVDRLTGGSGLSFGSDSFSEIEAGILETQMEAFTKFLPTVWKHSWEFNKLTFEFNAGEYQPNKKIADRDAVITYEYHILIGKGPLHKIILSYPNALLRVMLDGHIKASRTIETKVQLSAAAISKANIPAKVIIGDAQIAMSDLRNLAVGDILKLDTLVTSPLKLIVGNNTQLAVQPGIINNQLCAQVLLWDATSKPAERKLQGPGLSAPAVAAAASTAIVNAAALTTIESNTGVERAPIIDTPIVSLAGNEVADTTDEIGDLFGSDFEVDTTSTPRVTGYDDEDSLDDDHLEDDHLEDDNVDDHFDTNNIFDDDYSVEDPSDESDKAENASSDDDEFSWDDLEDDLEDDL